MEMQRINVEVDYKGKTSFEKMHPIRVKIGEAITFNLSLPEVDHIVKLLGDKKAEYTSWREEIDRLESVVSSCHEIIDLVERYKVVDPSKDRSMEEIGDDLHRELDNLKDYIDDVK